MSCEFKAGGISAKKLHCLTSDKNLKLFVPKFTTSSNLTQGEIEISSNFFVRGMYLEYENITFYPNYFDMEPGKKYTVRVSSTDIKTKNIKTTSLNSINK
jgi:hypothetical protein